MMSEEEKQRVIEHAKKSLQREVDRNIFIAFALANDIDVDTVLQEFDAQDEEDLCNRTGMTKDERDWLG